MSQIVGLLVKSLPLSKLPDGTYGLQRGTPTIDRKVQASSAR